MVGRIGSKEGARRWTLKGDADGGLEALRTALGDDFSVARSTAASAMVTTRSSDAQLTAPDGWTVTSQP